MGDLVLGLFANKEMLILKFFCFYQPDQLFGILISIHLQAIWTTGIERREADRSTQLSGARLAR